MILLIVAVNAYDDKSHDWSKPLYVAVYPVNVSGSPAVSKYIQSLTNDDFKEIERYFAEAGKPYGNACIYYRLGDEVKVLPPEAPRNGGMLDAILWSLKFRYYTYRHASDVGVPSNLRLFLNYYDPSPIISCHTRQQRYRMGAWVWCICLLIVHARRVITWWWRMRCCMLLGRRINMI